MADSTSTDQTEPSASSGDTPKLVRSPTASHSGAEADDDEEEDLCRICRCAGTTEDPLHYPCSCRGTIKFVHQNCLLQWIKHSSSRNCEVCRHPFSFNPIYAEKAPARLSLLEQLSWVVTKIWSESQFLTRLALVLFVWIMIVPFLTAQVWHMIFVRSLGELGGFRWFHSYSTIFCELVCGQVIFLCTVLVGAALWMCLELLPEYRIRVVGGGPNDRALFEGNESFGEVIGMRGPAINLAKHAFQLQLGIALLLVIGVFVPFSWGRIILHLMSATEHAATGYANDWTTLAVGYLCILSPAAIILGLYLLRQFSKDIVLSRTTVTKALSVCMGFVLELVRRGFILMVVLGAFPWVCGWWLDICTMKMVGLQLGMLVDLGMLFPPVRILSCWAYGIFSLVAIRKFLQILSEEVQQGTLHFLKIPRNINQNWICELTDASLHENAYRVLLHSGVSMILMVVLVYLPFKLVMQTVPSLFPLNFIIYYSQPSDLHWNTLGRLIRSRLVSRHYKPHSAFKFLLHHWLSLVCGALNLNDFLLPMNEDDNGNASTRRSGIVNESQDDQADSEVDLMLKVAALLILGLVTLVLLSSALIIIPISLGRAVFSVILAIPALSTIGRNDEINFLAGCYVALGGVAIFRSFINFVGTRRILSVVQLVGKWCIIGIKSLALLSISVLIIPLLTGLLANLALEMPFDMNMDERPVFSFHHIWILGCMLISTWIRGVMLDVGDTTFGNWRAKLERVKNDGFSHLRALWILREILYPIISNLLTWLCIPYIFAKGVFPFLGFSMKANSSVYHFAWLGYLVLSVLWYFVKRLRTWLASLHDLIKDDRYLIGKTLRNYGEDRN